MTTEQKYKSLCRMVEAYGAADHSQQIAENIIENPQSGSGLPFYREAAELLADVLKQLDKETTPRALAAVLNRIYKSAAKKHPDAAGVIQCGDRCAVTDGFRVLRLNSEPKSLPKAKNQEIDIEQWFKGLGKEEDFPLPSLAALKVDKARLEMAHGKSDKARRYRLNNRVMVDIDFLIDMLQALPGCKAYKPKAYYAPIYFKAQNGDGILMPLNPNSGAERAEIKATWEADKVHGAEAKQKAYQEALEREQSAQKAEQERKAREQAEYEAELNKKKEEAEQKRKAEEAREKEKQERESAKYEGYTEQLPPMQAARVKKALSKPVRIESGAVMEKWQFMKYLLKQGYEPRYRENVQTYSRRGLSEPKAEYSMKRPDEAAYYTVSKTEHDFAAYLLSKTAAEQTA